MSVARLLIAVSRITMIIDPAIYFSMDGTAEAEHKRGGESVKVSNKVILHNSLHNMILSAASIV